MPTYVFRAFFTKSKVGVAPSAAPTVDVCDSAGTLVVTGGAVTTLSGIVGLYGYAYTNATPGEYIALFKTTDTTVDLAQLPSWTPTVIYATPTAEQNADAVWDEALSGHTTAGSAGAALAADPLLNAVPGSYASGTAGWRLGTYGTASVSIVSPVADDESITVFYGDDYLAADGRALDFTFTNVPTLTAGTIALIVQAESGAVSFAGTVTGAAACRVELTSAQVNSIGVGEYRFDLQATLSNGHSVKLVQSTMIVAKSVA